MVTGVQTCALPILESQREGLQPSDDPPAELEDDVETRVVLLQVGQDVRSPLDQQAEKQQSPEGREPRGGSPGDIKKDLQHKQRHGDTRQSVEHESSDAENEETPSSGCEQT